MGPALNKQKKYQPPLPVIARPPPESLPEGLPHRWASQAVGGHVTTMFPHELWGVILAFLPQKSIHAIRLIDKKFYNFYWDLLTIFDMSKTRNLVDENCIAMIHKVGPKRVTLISFEYCHFLTPNIFPFIAQTCTNLTILDLKGTKLFQRSAIIYLEELKSLTALRLDYTFVEQRNFSGFPGLKVLSLLGTELIDHQEHKPSIFQDLPNLEVLLIPPWAYPPTPPPFSDILHLRLLVVADAPTTTTFTTAKFPDFPDIACHFFANSAKESVYLALKACEKKNKSQRRPGISIAWLVQKWEPMKPKIE